MSMAAEEVPEQAETTEAGTSDFVTPKRKLLAPKQKKSDDLASALEANAKILKDVMLREDTEDDLFGKYVASALKKIPERIKPLARLKITQVLYEVTDQCEVTERVTEGELEFQYL